MSPYTHTLAPSYARSRFDPLIARPRLAPEDRCVNCGFRRDGHLAEPLGPPSCPEIGVTGEWGEPTP